MIPNTWCIALYTGNNGNTIAGPMCSSRPRADP